MISILADRSKGKLLQQALNMMMIHNRFFSASALFVLLLSPSADSLDFNYSLFHEGEYSDNFDKTQNNTHKEFTSRIGAHLNFNSEPARSYQLEASYTLSYEHYLYDSTDDRLPIFSDSVGDLFFSYEIIEDVLSWDVQHTQDYLITDSAGADTENNRQRRSILVTGPTLNWEINPTGVDQLILSTEYSSSRFEETEEANSERKTGTLRWRHLSSMLTSFSLTTQYDSVAFDADSRDYEIFRYSVGMERKLKQGNFISDLGINETKPAADNPNPSQKGRFINASLRNQWGRHALDFSLGRQLTDSSFGLGNSTDNNAIVQDIIEQQNIAINYTHDFSTDKLSFQLYWDDEDYQVEQEDQVTLSLVMGYTRTINNRSSWTLTSRTNTTDFKEDERIDKDIIFGGGASYNYRLTRNMQLSFGLNYEGRVTFKERQVIGSVSARDYKETTARFSIRYTPE